MIFKKLLFIFRIVHTFIKVLDVSNIIYMYVKKKKIFTQNVIKYETFTKLLSLIVTLMYTVPHKNVTII